MKLFRNMLVKKVDTIDEFISEIDFSQDPKIVAKINYSDKLRKTSSARYESFNKHYSIDLLAKPPKGRNILLHRDLSMNEDPFQVGIEELRYISSKRKYTNLILKNADGKEMSFEQYAIIKAFIENV